MRCALYLRVSSEQQAAGVIGAYSAHDEAKYSLPTQEATCRAYAADQGWTIDPNYIYREAYSGYELWERDVLTRLRQDMAREVFDVILVHSLERLSRDTDHQSVIFSEADRYGVRIDSATETIDDTPVGKFLRQGLGFAGAIEGLRFRERSMRGRKARIDSGKMPSMPNRIFGYDWQDDARTAIIINDTEARWVRRIFEEVAAGTSLRQVALTLRDARVPSTRGKISWGADAIRRIIENTVYMGEMYAYKSKKVKNKNGKKQTVMLPQNEWYKCSYTPPSIVSAELWNKAQREKATPFKKRKPTSTNRPFLLDGHKQAICGFCGTQMSRIIHHHTRKRKDGSTLTRKIPIYKHNTPSADLHGCSKFSVQANLVDDAVLAYIEKVIRHPEYYLDDLATNAEKDPTRYNREAAHTQLDRVTEEHKSLSTTFGLSGDKMDEMTRGIILAQLSEKAKEVERWKHEVAALDEQHAQWQEQSINTQQMIAILKNYSHAVLGAMTLEEKQALTHVLGVQVRMYPKSHDPQWEGTLSIAYSPDGAEFKSPSPAAQDCGVSVTSCSSTCTRHYIHHVFDPYSLEKGRSAA